MESYDEWEDVGSWVYMFVYRERGGSISEIEYNCVLRDDERESRREMIITRSRLIYVLCVVKSIRHSTIVTSSSSANSNRHNIMCIQI